MLGFKPNLASTPAMSKISSPFLKAFGMVFTTVTRSFTNCVMSLSPVEMITRNPCASACFARAPITSSASTSSTINRGHPIATIAACSGSTWLRKSSGILGRFALYSGYISSRKVLPLASKTHAL